MLPAFGGVVVAVALLLLIAGWRRRSRALRRDRGLLNRLHNLPSPPPTSFPSGKGCSSLLQNLLSERLERGLPLPTGVDLRIEGTFCPKPGGKWLPFGATQTLVPPRGFLWKASIAMGPLRIEVADHFLDGKGAVEPSLFGWIPLGRECGPDIAKSALGRLLLETFWMPSALLDETRFEVDQVSERVVRVKSKPGGQKFDLHFDSSGHLSEVIGDRWGDPAKTGVFHWVPFGGKLSEPENFEGITLPTQVRGGWWYGTEKYFEFYRAKVVSARFF